MPEMPHPLAPVAYHVRVPHPVPTVYLHIGAPKTGTTYLQAAMWRNRELLAAHGVTVPGTAMVDHFYAALDIRQLAFKGYDNPLAKGMWGRLSGAALDAPTSKVVLSHEILAGASAEDARRAVESLRPATVHVVYGSRDLARQLPAVWQETLKNGRRHTYRQFLGHTLSAHLRTENQGFWHLQDPVVSLRAWSSAVPPENIHIVTLPQVGTSGSLWDRFCTALEIPADGFDLDIRRSNSSLNRIDAELLRRLNKQLPRDLPWPDYEARVKDRFNALADRATPGPRLVVPVRDRKKVMNLAAEIRAELAKGGYDVVGTLEDLIPAKAAFGKVEPPDQTEVADSAAAMLAELLLEPKPPPAAPSSRPAVERLRRLARRIRR